MNSRAFLLFACTALLSTGIWNRVAANHADSTTITIRGQTPGPTAFISKVDLTAASVDSVTSIRFTIAPKPGSVTRPISATYALGYLQSRGYVDSAKGQITVPVFGLYADYSNTVTLTYSFHDGTSRSENLTIAYMAAPINTSPSNSPSVPVSVPASIKIVLALNTPSFTVRPPICV